MNKEILLDAYIVKTYPSAILNRCTTEEMKLIKEVEVDSVGFARFQLQVAWEDFIDSIIESICEDIEKIRKAVQKCLQLRK